MNHVGKTEWKCRAELTDQIRQKITDKSIRQQGLANNYHLPMNDEIWFYFTFRAIAK